MRNGKAWLIVGALLCMGMSQAEDEIRRLTDEGRRMSGKIIEQIRGELLKEMERTGPLRAIIVCKYSAPEITSALSRQHGMRITRVSLRPRNRATGEADAWEQQILLDFEKRQARGEKPENLEHAEIVQEPAGRFFRYMKALPTAPVCATCHGQNLSEGVKAQLATEYPGDRAADYPVGSVRGAVSIKKGL